MNSNFILLNNTYKTIDYVNNLLINFPKKNTVLKNYIESNLYKLIENLFAYNINDTNRIREKYLKEYLICLSMLNFLIHEAFLKKCISYKQGECVGNYFNNLKKIALSLMKGLNVHE